MFKRAFKILFLFLLFFLTAGICAYFTVSFIIKSEDTVVVPDLISKDIIYVLEVLSGLNLNTKVVGSKYSDNIPKNHIIWQSPEAGSVIKIDRDLRVVISKGTKFVSVPNLKNISVRQGTIILEENNLSTGFFSKTSDPTVKKDYIICQFPVSGSVVKRGTKVNLLISTGEYKKQFMMINLTYLSLDNAIINIENCGLKIGKIQTKYIKGIPLDVICEQNPEPGFPVTEKTAVNIVINRKATPENQCFSNITGVKLFRYKTQNGFLNKHVRIQMNCFDSNINLYDKFVKPGEELWSIIPKNTNVSIFVYENGELVQTKIFTMYEP